MNLERIAEIEAAFGEETLMAVIDFADVAELCRLARLGLRVEGAPVANVASVWSILKGQVSGVSYTVPCHVDSIPACAALVSLSLVVVDP